MNKEELEIQAIQQDISHKRKHLFFAIIGIFIAVSTLAIERYSAYEQRNHQMVMMVKEKKLNRMLAIAKSFEELFSKTIGTINEAKTDSLFLAMALDTINEKLSENNNLKKEASDFLLFSTELSKKLHNDNALEIREFSKAIELQSVWEAKYEGFAPDLEQLFGIETQNKSKEVAHLGWAALNEEYNIFSDGGDSLNKFKDAGNELAKLLRSRINALVEKEPNKPNQH